MFDARMGTEIALLSEITWAVYGGGVRVVKKIPSSFPAPGKRPFEKSRHARSSFSTVAGGSPVLQVCEGESRPGRDPSTYTPPARRLHGDTAKGATFRGVRRG